MPESQHEIPTGWCEGILSLYSTLDNYNGLCPNSLPDHLRHSSPFPIVPQTHTLGLQMRMQTQRRERASGVSRMSMLSARAGTRPTSVLHSFHVCPPLACVFTGFRQICSQVLKGRQQWPCALYRMLLSPAP